MLKLSKRNLNDKSRSINRCYFDAEHGRVKLALDRLSDLENEFGRDSIIVHTEADIRSRFLGQGLIAYRLFGEAFNLNPEKDYAIANAINMSPTREAFLYWVQKASILFNQYPSIKQMCSEIEQYFSQGISRYQMHVLAYDYNRKEKEWGISASFAEIALQEGKDEMKLEEEINIRRMRAEALRALDDKAFSYRESIPELFPPDERLALHEAIAELDNITSLDEFEAEAYNLKAAWKFLLMEYEQTIQLADKAISLRPNAYAKPWINRSLALWDLKRYDEARISLLRALKKAEKGQDQKDIENIKHLLKYRFVIPPTPSLRLLMPAIREIIHSAKKCSGIELEGSPLSVSFFIKGLKKRISPFGMDWDPNYIKIMSELLIDLSPETAFLVINRQGKFMNKKKDFCLYAALYLIVHATGTLRRDATRFFVFFILSESNPMAIKRFYRKKVLEPAAASEEYRNLPNLINEELERKNLYFPELIAEQEPIDENRIKRIYNDLNFLFKDN